MSVGWRAIRQFLWQNAQKSQDAPRKLLHHVKSLCGGGKQVSPRHGSLQASPCLVLACLFSPCHDDDGGFVHEIIDLHLKCWLIIGEEQRSAVHRVGCSYCLICGCLPSNPLCLLWKKTSLWLVCNLLMNHSYRFQWAAKKCVIDWWSEFKPLFVTVGKSRCLNSSA